jgi:hypothetical protein
MIPKKRMRKPSQQKSYDKSQPATSFIDDRSGIKSFIISKKGLVDPNEHGQTYDEEYQQDMGRISHHIASAAPSHRVKTNMSTME